MHYALNADLEARGNKLISETKSLEPLKIIKVGYLFRAEAPVSEGKVTVGMAIRCDDRNWAIHKTDALIEIARDVWEEASEQFKDALMDHELSHLAVILDENDTPVMDEATGRIKIRIKKHDIEEFSAVLERRGAYHEALRDFLDAFAKNKENQKRAKKAGMTAGSLGDTDE